METRPLWRQRPNETIPLPVRGDRPIDETQADVIEVTLEFVMHLDTLIGALSSRP